MEVVHLLNMTFNFLLMAGVIGDDTTGQDRRRKPELSRDCAGHGKECPGRDYAEAYSGL